MNAHNNLVIPVASATAVISVWIERIAEEKRYSRTVLAMALLRAAERLVNSDDSIRGPVREAIAEEACQAWTRIVGQTDRMASRS